MEAPKCIAYPRCRRSMRDVTPAYPASKEPRASPRFFLLYVSQASLIARQTRSGVAGMSMWDEGLFLGRTALIEHRGSGYEVRAPAEIDRLFKRAYGYPDIAPDRLMRGLGGIAAALGERNLCLAQIAAVHLRLPDLPDMISRSALEAEDALIKTAHADRLLARGSWDPNEHPRAGVPPNPGWFAPTGGSEAGPPLEIAQYEEERAPEEMRDPVAEVRQALWDARIATLRQLDPQNPNLSYFANPGSAPSQAALDRLDAEVGTAARRRVIARVMPAGRPIGEAGSSPDIRVLPGGVTAARELFDYLRVGGTEHLSNADTTVVRLPGSAGFLTFRQISASGDPAIDINFPGIVIKRIHFQ
jgi:hypothetical protein